MGFMVSLGNLLERVVVSSSDPIFDKVFALLAEEWVSPARPEERAAARRLLERIVSAETAYSIALMQGETVVAYSSGLSLMILERDVLNLLAIGAWARTGLDTPTFYCAELFVARQARGQGIGSKLIQANVKHATQLGYHRLAVDTQNRVVVEHYCKFLGNPLKHPDRDRSTFYLFALN